MSQLTACLNGPDAADGIVLIEAGSISYDWQCLVALPSMNFESAHCAMVMVLMRLMDLFYMDCFSWLSTQAHQVVQ